VGQPVTLFTIQNGIFPNRLRKMDYKFDLKGSANNRLLEKKALEKLDKQEDPIWQDRNFIEVLLLPLAIHKIQNTFSDN
jgi:hypothetical protein